MFTYVLHNNEEISGLFCNLQEQDTTITTQDISKTIT